MELKGSLLVAMPSMGDPRFIRSVICICDHSADGALGLIVNKPLTGLRFGEVCRQMGIETRLPVEPRVYFGGPVAPERGFILHSADHDGGAESIRVGPGLILSADQSVLRDIGAGKGPDRFLFALGYSGWGPGQLEGELEQDGWLVLPAEEALIFEVSDEAKWSAVGARHGIDLHRIHTQAGNA